MHETRALRTLEVGLGFGGSTPLIGASHKGLGHPPPVQHTGIDPFQFGTPVSLRLSSEPRFARHNPNNR